MPDLKDVIEAAAARLRTAFDGQTAGGRIYSTAPDTIDPDSIVIVPSIGDFIDYDVTFDGRDNIELTIKVFAGTQASRAGQEKLMQYFSRSGTLSIRAALYADRTLGSVVHDLEVQAGRGWGDVEWGGVVFFGAELGLLVMA